MSDSKIKSIDNECCDLSFSDRAISLLEQTLIDIEESIAFGSDPKKHIMNSFECVNMIKNTLTNSSAA